MGLCENDVTVRRSIEAAITWLRLAREVDVVLVDYDLEDGKGDALVRWLRSSGFAGHVVAVSAHEHGNQALLEAGANVVCPKGDFAQIAARLRPDLARQAQDGCRGALLGTIVGDALGRPFEGAPTSDRARLARALKRRVEAPRAWGHSDDGEMMLSVAQSLAARGAVEEAHLLAALAGGHDPARGYGKGTRAAFRVFDAGGTWEQAARALWPEGSRGNGGAVRVAPVAVFALDHDEASVAELARRSAAPTHAHREARDAAAIVAVAVHRAARGVMLPDVVRGLARLSDGVLGARVRAIELGMSADDVVERLGAGVLAIESVPAALWAVTGSTSFADAVLRATGLGGDTDSIGAIAGAIAGAAYGAGAVSPSWLGALELGVVERIDSLCAQLTASGPPPEPGAPAGA